MTALMLAGRHPAALLPCPVCAASVKGENLPRHLDKTHPDASDGAALPARLRIEPGAVVLRRRGAHIRLDAPAFVTLQYALADSGALTLRGSAVASD